MNRVAMERMIRMSKYLCENCDEVFEGESAKEEIIKHVFECVVVEVKERKETKLEKKLKEKYPFIVETDFHFGEFDEKDCMLLTREDGTLYSVDYRYPNDSSRKLTEEEQLERICKQVDTIEGIIKTVVDTVKNDIPQSDIRFEGYVPNTGYLGNGYRFSFLVGESRLQSDYFGGGTDSFIKRIYIYYANEVTGRLQKIEDEYQIEGVNVSAWLDRNKGKICTLRSLG